MGKICHGVILLCHGVLYSGVCLAHSNKAAYRSCSYLTSSLSTDSSLVVVGR